MKTILRVTPAALCITAGLLCAACAATTPAISATTPAMSATPVPSATLAATPDTAQADMQSAAIQGAREFILYGQQDVPEAGRIRWVEEFLDAQDMIKLYGEYAAAGGAAGDAQGFAQYITDNAPIREDWRQMFEAVFAREYGEKISRYELIQQPYYEVYVELGDGSVVPYVSVNARTGYFHG